MPAISWNRAARRLPSWLRSLDWPVAIGLVAPVVTAVVGLRLTDRLVSALGRQFASLDLTDIVGVLDDRAALLNIQLVFGAFFVTDFVAALVVPIIWAFTGSLTVETRRWARRWALTLGCIFGLGMPLLASIANHPPMWDSMAGPLYRNTVLPTLRFYQLSTDPSGAELLNTCILLSNIVFGFGSAFVVAAVWGLHREFRAAARRIVIGVDTLDRAVALTISFVYRLQTMLLLASIVMVSGIANMVAWRFWPLAYLPKMGAAATLRLQYQGLAEGSVILQGVVFTLILLAIFLPPIVVLNNLTSANPALFERIRKDSSVTGFLSAARSAILHASPLAAGIAAAWIGG